ncbi:tetratricopeptide repeat protein [Planctomycetota bacterium]
MAGRSFLYFRDPAYSENRGSDFQAEDDKTAKKQDALKELIRRTCKDKQIPLHENYPDPAALSELVLNDLKAVIDNQFPEEEIPDSLVREAHSHEYFAEIRRRTYIGRDDYFKTLDHHIDSDGGPLVVLGDSGSGKTALLANWLAYWRKEHPGDFIFQHYIGNTPDSADHWQLMRRLVTEIKQWSDDPDELPTSHDDILRDFRLWLSKARLKAQRDSVRCILILDALNQLEDQDNSRLLGWLPSDAFTGPLRLVVSTLPGDTLNAIQKYGWETLRIEKLTEQERPQMIVDYLHRFGKELDPGRIDRIISAPATANPLYLKILLDELRVTGTHDKLDERLNTYLAEPDIPSLLKNVLVRYQRHYENDREGLVKETLGLIFSARRGLSETELLQLLRPDDLDQLPQAIWTPLRAAMEELLIDRGGILNFAHDFLRTAVEEAFVPDPDNKDDLHLQLADYFEKLPASPRSCDELPWLLWQRRSKDQLRTCLLDIDRFLEIFKRDKEELQSYWIGLGEQIVMGESYLKSFERWSDKQYSTHTRIGYAAHQIACFLNYAALYTEAETLYRRALSIDEKRYSKEHPEVAARLNNLAELLRATNRMIEAEPLYRKALSINEKNFSKEHPNIAACLNNLALLLKTTNRMDEAETLYRRALNIDEKSFGKEHPHVAKSLNNLAQLLQDTNRMTEAESLMRRALNILNKSVGKEHPLVATVFNNLASLMQDTNRMDEAESLYRRALNIHEECLGKKHPDVARDLNNLAQLLQETNRTDEAESLMRRALSIYLSSLGKEHPNVAISLNNLAQLLQETNRITEAESFMRRAVMIFVNIARSTKHQPQYWQGVVNNYRDLLRQMGYKQEQVNSRLRELGLDMFGGQ